MNPFRWLAVAAISVNTFVGFEPSHAAEVPRACTAILTTLVDHLPRSRVMEVYQATQVPGGGRLLRSRATAGKVPFETGHIREVALAHPETMARFGITVPLGGYLEYPDVDLMNKKLAALPSQDDPGIRMVWVRGKITPEDYIELWGQGYFPVSDTGSLHFHDTHVHMAATLFMPKEFHAHVKSLSSVVYELVEKGEGVGVDGLNGALDNVTHYLGEALAKPSPSPILIRSAFEPYMHTHNWLVHGFNKAHPELVKKYGLREMTESDLDAYRDHVLRMLSPVNQYK